MRFREENKINSIIIDSILNCGISHLSRGPDSPLKLILLQALLLNVLKISRLFWLTVSPVSSAESSPHKFTATVVAGIDAYALIIFSRMQLWDGNRRFVLMDHFFQSSLNSFTTNVPIFRISIDKIIDN